MRRRHTAWIAGGLLLVGLAVTAGTLRKTPGPIGDVPTTRVRRGDLEVQIQTSGDLRSVKSSMLLGPPVGGTLQIVTLKPTGTLVQAQEVILEFDPSEQEFNLEQARSEVLEVEEEIKKTHLDAASQAAVDEVALLQARFEVRRAELEVTRNELASAIDAQKNLLSLEEARRRLAQLEADVPSRQASNRASLAVLEEKLQKARLKVQQAQRAIEEMKLRTPVAGLVSVQENRGLFGGWRPPGMTFPEYREGDLVNAGAAVAEVLQAEQMEIKAKLDEADRTNVSPGLATEVRVEGLPGLVFPGTVKSVAGLAGRSFFPGQKKFDMVIQFDKPESRLRAGLTAQIAIRGEALKAALLLPRQVVFEQDGKTVVYVPKGGGFESREIKVKRRSESLVAVEGIEEGADVALVNPEAGGSKAKGGAPAAPPMAGSR